MLKINKRQQKIISTLLNNEQYLSGNNLAKISQISVKTVQKEIKEINSFLDGYQCSVISKKGFGYKIQYENYDNYNQLKSIFDENGTGIFPTIEKNRVDWLVKKLALLYIDEERSSIKLDELCDELYISMSTLKNDLKIVKKILNSYDLELSRSGNIGIGIKGKETKFRYFISDYIVHRDNDISQNSIFEAIDEDLSRKIKEFMLKVIKTYELNITDLGFDNLFNHIVITLTRIKSKKIINYSKNIDPDTSVLEYKAAEELCKFITENFDVEFPKEEITYIYQHLISQNKLLLNQQYIFDDEDQLNLDIVNKALDEIYTKIGLDFTKDTMLMSGLITHLKSVIHRIKLGMNIRNDLLEDIKKNYLLAFELANILSSIIENESQIKVDENEVGFLALHFGGALERLSIKDRKDNLKVIVICASGMGTSILLKSKLLSRFSNQIEVVGVYPSYKLDDLDLNDVDFIISTINIHYKRLPVIYISPIFSESDINKVSHFINKGNENYKVNIGSFFKDDLFSTDLEFENRIDAIRYMSNRMFELGYIDKEMKESFVERENMSTTEIGNMVAIPHAIIGQVKTPCIHVSILKKPMKWCYGEVQLIMMIAIDKKVFIDHEDLFLKIYEKIDELYKVEKIISKKDLNYIKKLYHQED